MEQMNAEQEESVNVDRFMELVDRYTDFTELTTPMLNEFIDKVIVYEAGRSTAISTTRESRFTSISSAR